MNISIFDHELPYESHNIYDVTLYGNRIRTIVTHVPDYVDSWISDVERIHRRRLHCLVVGLDVEWRPNFSRYVENPVATLQLCVGRMCLIFQILYASFIPQSLKEFLSNPGYTFTGVGIEADVEKLTEEHGLEVANMTDLRGLAVGEYGRDFQNAGLKTLAREVLGLEVNKPRSITTSRWDNEWLTPQQVQYACIDAFLSFEIGKTLNAGGN